MLVHYLLDGIAICSDPAPRARTADPRSVSCAVCRAMLALVGAFGAPRVDSRKPEPARQAR